MKPDASFGHDLLPTYVQWTALERFISATSETRAVQLQRGSPHSIVIAIAERCLGAEREWGAASVAAATEAPEQGAGAISAAEVERTPDRHADVAKISGARHRLVE